MDGVILALLIAGVAYFVWSHLKDRVKASNNTEKAAE
jgi:hypothetical protein